MTQYIDKSAVVAEIEKRIKKYASIDIGNNSELEALYGAKCHALRSVLAFLDTLEVKEVDLEKEIDTETGYEWDKDKKKLKKSQRIISAEAKEAMYGKPAWSEEDEHRLKDTIYFLDTAKKHYASTVELNACIEWLKSLKKRMEQL